MEISRQHLITQSQRSVGSDGMCASAERVGQRYCEITVPSSKAHGSQAKLVRTGIKVMGTVRKLTSTIKILTYLS